MTLDKAAQSALDYLLKTEKIIDSVGNGVKCLCSTKHVPLPVRFYRIRGETLCPTAHANVIVLLEMYRLCGDDGPSGKHTKHFGKYIRNVVTALLAHQLLNESKV
jgi:hypothetical protein